MTGGKQPVTSGATASILSNLFFWWTLPLFRHGYRKSIEQEDIENALPQDSTEMLGKELSKLWEEELQKPKPSLLRALFRMFTRRYVTVLLFLLMYQCALRVSLPILMGLLISYMKGKYSTTEGWILGGLFVLITFTGTLIYHNTHFRLDHMGIRIRVALVSVLYQKILRLSKASLGATGVGELANIFSNDLSRFERDFSDTAYVLVSPIQLVVVTVVLWYQTGPACFAGLFFLYLMLSLQGFSGKYREKVREAVAEKTDARVKILNEILNGILVVKMYTWEKPYELRMAELRSAEIKAIRKRCNFVALNICMFDIMSKVCMLLTFSTFVLTDRPVTAESVFVTLAMYNVISSTSALFFPVGAALVAEGLVAIRRIQRVLLLEDRVPRSLPKSEAFLSAPGQIRVTRLKSRRRKANDPAFHSVDIQLESGQLFGIVGSVGSGKSTLLETILGEVMSDAGSAGGDGVELRGKVAYASQEPCLFPGSVRDNILFGLPFDSVWYEMVLEACALTRDLTVLPHGDHTLVGDKGINLSGGQKTRIALARAVYSRADVYLLDDPLSAVDSRVARHLMEECVHGLLREKCVLLVTHQTHLLRDATWIVYMDKGMITRSGTYNEIYADDLNADFQFSMTIDDIHLDEPVSDMISSIEYQPRYPEEGAKGYGTFDEEVESEPLQRSEESRGTGSLSWSFYWSYFRAGSSFFNLMIALLLIIATQTLASGCDIWLKQWTDFAETKSSTEPSERHIFYMYIYAYVGLIGVLLVFSVTRALRIFYILISSAATLHNRLLISILRAPMRFFEVNSVGRVLNRFSNDMGVLDEYLPQLFFICAFIFCQVLGSLVVVVLMNYYLIVPTALLLYFADYLRRHFVPVSAEIKRLEAIARSPVFTQLTTTLDGISVVRAFQAEELLTAQVRMYQDRQTASVYANIASSRGFQLGVELLVDIFIAFIILIFLASSSSASAFGLALSTSLALTLDVQQGLMTGADIVKQMVAVERVLEYASVKPEAPLVVKGRNVSSSWLERGEVRMDQVNLTYENQLKVLKDITLKIMDGEKIGIVGRSGAGKSSLISLLFRIVEPSSGTIHISNVDISRLGLHDLRPQLAFIPQNPILFSGSLRHNLDPFHLFDNADLYEAIQAVQLDARLLSNNSINDLELELYEGGANLSHGEKQLLCLARTILRQSKILVLDEATASIDTKTDAIIQDTLRKRFRSSTVLTVAHRLDTVMDNDKILVLDSGHIREFDTPSMLLRNREGFLYNLVENTGRLNSEKLRRAADQAELARTSKLRHSAYLF